MEDANLTISSLNTNLLPDSQNIMLPLKKNPRTWCASDMTKYYKINTLGNRNSIAKIRKNYCHLNNFFSKSYQRVTLMKPCEFQLYHKVEP